MASANVPPNIFDASAPAQEGPRATESNHRKIELQHPDDWTYLIANVTAAAREKIENHFAAAAAASGEQNGKNDTGKKTKAAIEEERKLKERVEALVDEYIQATYNSAKDSVSINGMDAREMEAELAKYQEGEELEPFDGKLAQKIQLLSTQVEDQTLSLANLRRKLPRDTAANFRQNFETRSEAYDGKVKSGEATQMLAAKNEAEYLAMQGEGEGEGERGMLLPRSEDMREIFERGREELNTLKGVEGGRAEGGRGGGGGLGGAVARMERARRAVELVEEK